MDSLQNGAADVESLGVLSRFRRDFHACLTARTDQLRELAAAPAGYRQVAMACASTAFIGLIANSSTATPSTLRTRQPSVGWDKSCHGPCSANRIVGQRPSVRRLGRQWFAGLAAGRRCGRSRSSAAVRSRAGCWRPR